MRNLKLIAVSALLILLVNLAGKQSGGSAWDICPILIGERIPDVELQSVQGENINLRKIVSEKPTILIFYRGGWCPYCNRHLSDLYTIEKELMDLGYQIIAVSMDKPSKLKETSNDAEFNYVLLSDSKAEAVKKFGLAFKVEDEQAAKLKEHGMNLEEASGYTHHILPVPAAFILDQEGEVKFSFINPDYKTRVKASVLLEAARAEISE